MVERLPTLFVSHGSPMTAIEPGAAGLAWSRAGQDLPRPRAILVASAHWDTAVPMLTGTTRLRTIHDFNGFPQPLYDIRYEPAGAPDVAREAATLLKEAGYAAGIDGTRGIDHGAWVPLRWMYPDADIPVVQLSVQTERGAAHHWQVGRALAPLRDAGVLVIGSGHATHNLRDWSLAARQGTPLPYVGTFADWLAGRIAANDADAVIGYRDRGPEAMRAHPTEEHFLPLLVAWGAAGDGAHAERFHREIFGGALAMDAYRFDAAA